MKARIKDGAWVSIDMSQARWHDNGEVFEVEDFMPKRKRLVAPGYGKAGAYGNGALFVNESDLTPLEEPKKERCLAPRRESCKESCSVCEWSRTLDYSTFVDWLNKSYAKRLQWIDKLVENCDICGKPLPYWDEHFCVHDNRTAKPNPLYICDHAGECLYPSGKCDHREKHTLGSSNCSWEWCCGERVKCIPYEEKGDWIVVSDIHKNGGKEWAMDSARHLSLESKVEYRAFKWSEGIQ